MPDQPGVSKIDARRRGYTFPCKRCGKLFTAKRCTATWCSPACRKYAQRSREHTEAIKLHSAVFGSDKSSS